MIYLCKCGARKNGQPSHSAATKSFTCFKCRQKLANRPKPKQEKPVTLLAVYNRSSTTHRRT